MKTVLDEHMQTRMGEEVGLYNESQSATPQTNIT